MTFLKTKRILLKNIAKIAQEAKEKYALYTHYRNPFFATKIRLICLSSHMSQFLRQVLSQIWIKIPDPAAENCYIIFKLSRRPLESRWDSQSGSGSGSASAIRKSDYQFNIYKHR
jgi:hypothetical protein